jgi:DNA-binding MarR family transcriptional regulator
MSNPPAKVAVGLWIRLAKVYGLMLREVRDSQTHSDVTLAQFDVLAQLLRHPEGMTSGELSDALLVTAGNVTGLVDRMSARGWVTRRASSTDQRVRIVKLTALGKRIAAREVKRQEQMLGEILGSLSASDQAALTEKLDSLRSVLENAPRSEAYVSEESHDDSSRYLRLRAR